jgi:D-alanyl-D-alanine carboxypeptidase (penicillin-binding protein 5/6)
MTFQRSLILGFSLLALVLGSGTLGAATKKKAAASEDQPDSYKGAIVMDAASGRVLFEKGADTVSPPASMTKLMTFAVLHDFIASGNLSLTTPITTTAPDTRMGGTQVWLKEGEVFPVEDLLYAVMIQSANDAAYALARTAAGSVDAFVARMNEKARELGMTHTTFRTPHGLPPSNRSIADSDLTSPRDFAILSRHLLLHTDILKYTIRQRSFGAPTRVKLVDMVNHNHLLGKVAGVDGLKTGFTGGAMYCLAATAQRDQRRVIVVVMGSPTWKERDLKVIELIEKGFAQIPVGSSNFVAQGSGYAKPAADSPFASAPLTHTEKSATEATPSQDAPKGDEPMIRLNVPAAKKTR